MSSGISVDTRGVLEVFASLDVKSMSKIHRAALAKSASVLVKEAGLKLQGVTNRSSSTRTADRRGWSSNKTRSITSLKDGIRYYVSKNTDFSKVHIMKDFRLKFFEMGTNERVKRSGASTGRMVAKPFFSPAINASRGKMVSVMRKTIEDAVLKKAKQ